MGNEGVTFFKVAVKKQSELFIETQVPGPVAVYPVYKEIVKINTWLGHIIIFTWDNGKTKLMETVVRNSNSKQSKVDICYTFGLLFFLCVNNVHSGVYFVI
jgi:hypothetical protein